MVTLHSFLFALLPYAVLVSTNVGMVPVSATSITRSLAVIVGGNIVLLAALSLWRPLKAASMTLSWLYILLTLYPLLSRLMTPLFPRLPEVVWAVPHAAAAVAAAVWLGRPRSGSDSRYKSLNVAGLVVIGGNLAVTAVSVSAQSDDRWRAAVASLVAGGPAPAAIPEQRPDIYYIILDGLGRPDVLSRVYGLDVSRELQQLREAGWTVATASRSNYSQTYLSLASALNGAYLDPLGSAMGDTGNRRPLQEMIQSSGPIRALKQAGYRFHMIGSHTSVTADHRMADTCDCRRPGLSEFENGLLWSTWFRVLPLYDSTYGPHYRSIVEAFDRMEAEPRGAPTVVLTHVLAPHPPFVVDGTGQPVMARGPVVYNEGEDYPGTVEKYRQGYRAQAQFIIRRLVAFARTVNARRRPAVVVVHGDHGPGSSYSHTSLARTDVSERFPVFMAMRLGSGAAAQMPDDLSPVNVFRVVFNARFGATYALLPNRSYYATWRKPYRFSEVRVP